MTRLIPAMASMSTLTPQALPFLEGTTVDYVENLMGSGFKVDAPPRKLPTAEGPIAERIQQLLDEQINPSLASHGGGATLMDVKDGIAFIEIGGGCQGCAMSQMTLKNGIETLIKENIPEITEVLDVTDHAERRNPYYQA
ncbi:MAG: hypothetical protein COS85_03315 [Armatimonadetes bacterium CG07_land_8_20_14_0_80_59_28]|nr:MAG: hypothetical protein COS85_03315 [Armatimonadetes bacterium CG07_land_8_20_14_0_80_59_28]PIX41512.1 MAG: hypothetical protein COZ56_11825 [Armatimonadetes bacterium CG_4_8_14_3_um_filter_58_9]PIY47866.1 MAG: hypothetical protein COZ05_04485 [Armatimonadetes bacterium CG_4_10_14_3_um_filter_59_10]PJB67360.1 MAG: hypothetical protein CO095_12200 [Armatimonadetes bacterium CG_4_9_14_3_um_filter_58_7]